MAKLEEYMTFKEKLPFFWKGDEMIDRSVDYIFKELELMQSKVDFAFRGSSEAKHKLYNSCQRYYINTELFGHGSDESDHYELFVTRLIEHTKQWNRGTVASMLQEMDISPDNSLAYLSYMQHFGIPSPLLDFTTDPFVALFFAIDGMQFQPSDNEIDNYFSVYAVLTNTVFTRTWEYVFEKNTEAGKTLPYSEVSRNTLAIISNSNPAYRIINNTNIINQKGLFFYTNNSQDPLEKVFFDNAEFMKGEVGEERFKQEFLGHHEFGRCFNIHKSLAPYIIDVLSERGITKEYIYPDVWKMKQSVVHRAVTEILVKDDKAPS